MLRETFTADGADAVEQRMRQMYGVAFMNTELAMHDELVIGDRFMIGQHDFSGSASVQTAPATSLIIAAASGGRWDWELGEARGSGLAEPFLIGPDEPSMIELGDTHVDSVVLDVDALTGTARAMYADDSLAVRVEDGFPVSTGAARIVRHTLVQAAAMQPLILESDLAAATLYRSLAMTALECFPLHGDPVARRVRAGEQHDAYRRACTVIEDLASLPITVEDVASAVGQPVAALQAAFHAWSPTGRGIADHLRRVRLEAADPTRGSHGPADRAALGVPARPLRRALPRRLRRQPQVGARSVDPCSARVGAPEAFDEGRPRLAERVLARPRRHRPGRARGRSARSRAARAASHGRVAHGLATRGQEG